MRATKIKSTADDEIVIVGSAAHASGMKNVVHDGPTAPNLVDGTAWAFADPTAVGQFDYLFVDEAGQVALANLVGMSTSSRSVVLLGDQMQLSQPTQGAHPGEAGLSALDYLLGGHRTIPCEHGIFLGTTWRMHPALCRFISGAIYEDRLTSDPNCERRCLSIPQDAKRIRARAGLVFVPVVHEGNVQASDEEVEVVRAIVAELHGRTLTEKTGETRSMTEADVLVVAPYNMQVRRLRAALPGVRVGSVDKFQGQEAPVVIVSMCASAAEGSARGLGFLFDPNRLNVAISRAQCLAIVVGSPQLARARVSSVAQTCLANLFCRIVADGSGGRGVAA